jgi:hypothetical protein
MTEESKLQRLKVNEMALGSSCSSDGASSSNASLLKVVDWNGADDPEKPVNWPRSKKNQILGAVCLMRFTTYGEFLHHYAYYYRS